MHLLCKIKICRLSTFLLDYSVSNLQFFGHCMNNIEMNRRYSLVLSSYIIMNKLQIAQSSKL